MIAFTLSKIAPILDAQWVGEDRIIQTVSIHSTKITKQCMFIALEGKFFDGHNFVDEAVFMGACALLVNRHFLLDIPQLIVKNTCFALSKLAFWVRRQVSSATVIAITGSSGKTSVKEMTAAILMYKGQVIATHGNFNNEIGVPLTLLRLTSNDNFAVIEVGANHFGEISRMSSFINPDIVLVNNIHPAHLFGFGSLVGIAEAKGEIFSNMAINGICVLNADNNAWLLWRKSLVFKSVLAFSVRKKEGVDFFSSDIVYNQEKVQFILHTPYGISPVKLSMLGEHSVSNALAASALAFSAGATLNEIVLGLEKISALPSRLYPIVFCNGKMLLDDSYNANIGSILAAIDVLKRMEGYRVIVISDIAELGNYMEVQYHRKIGKLIAMTNIDKVLSIGYLSYLISYFSERGEHFYDKNVLVAYLLELFKKYELITVLVKGSRNFLMDQVVKEVQGQIIC